MTESFVKVNLKRSWREMEKLRRSYGEYDHYFTIFTTEP
jgi:hypothetical protein